MGDEQDDEQHPSGDDESFDAMLRAVARPPGLERPLKAGVSSTVDMPPLDLAQFATPRVEEPQPGQVLDGRYRLERVLGRGGMGVVYAALNLRTQQPVAIKWLTAQASWSSSQAATMFERFRREARTAARIHHPNVVDVYDVGGPDDAPFLVMELLEGESLRTRMERGLLSWDEASVLFGAVMAGIAAAHRAGIVHRDLKPDNIFLSRANDSTEPVVKVLDFGVAAIRGGSADGLGSLTRSGAILGTPAYMPLEQVTGGKVDERADLYSLGVVLYEALTGCLPFAAKSHAELAVLQATGEPTPLSKYRPELGPACEALVMRALAREPERRYASADAFAASLNAVALPAKQSKVTSSRMLALVAILLSVLAGWAWQAARPQSRANVRAAGTRAGKSAPVSKPQSQVETEAPKPSALPVAQEIMQPPGATPSPSPSAAPRSKKSTRPAGRPTDLTFDDF